MSKSNLGTNRIRLADGSPTRSTRKGFEVWSGDSWVSDPEFKPWDFGAGRPLEDDELKSWGVPREDRDSSF